MTRIIDALNGLRCEENQKILMVSPPPVTDGEGEIKNRDIIMFIDNNDTITNN
jgi:hypothetical protein